MSKPDLLENVICFRVNNAEHDCIKELMKKLNVKTRSAAIKQAVMNYLKEKSILS